MFRGGAGTGGVNALRARFLERYGAGEQRAMRGRYIVYQQNAFARYLRKSEKRFCYVFCPFKLAKRGLRSGKARST